MYQSIYYMVDSMTKLVEENLAQSTDRNFCQKTFDHGKYIFNDQTKIEHIFGK